MNKKTHKFFLVFIVFLFLSTFLWSAYSEAPMLKERVQNGALPTVEDRLPENPKVIKTTESIGNYGGTLNIARGNEMRALMVEYALESYPNPSFDENLVEGNIIESWEVLDEGKRFIFNIRKGLRWSDGHYVTTEDVRFTFEDIYSNTDVQAFFPNWLMRNGERVKLTIVDEHTFELSFNESYGLFLLQLQSIARGSHHGLFNPSHYLKDYHLSYTSLSELMPHLEKEKLSEDQWGELFRRKWQSSEWEHRKDIGYPVLEPWIVVAKPSDNVVIYERNPYYHKVDEAGNQLPYIDRIRYESIGNQEMLNMKIISGEVDFTINTSLGNLALYKENERNGGYETLLVPLTSINTNACYFPNLTLDDDTWRLVMGNPNFRHALSYAIDREEINELIYYGFGTPSQASDAPGSPFVEPDFREAFVDYNPRLANKILDEMGMDKRDRNGWRLAPNGQPFTLNIEFFRVNENLVPATELVASYWQAIGINTNMRVIDGGLWYQRQGANNTTMSVWHEDASRPGNPFFFFVPYESINWGPNWKRWYETDGKEGEEPPLEVKQLFDYYEEFLTTPSNDRRIELGKKILESQSRNLWVIGTVNNVPVPVIVNKNLRNVKNGLCPQWGPSMAEQYYFK